MLISPSHSLSSLFSNFSSLNDNADVSLSRRGVHSLIRHISATVLRFAVFGVLAMQSCSISIHRIISPRVNSFVCLARSFLVPLPAGMREKSEFVADSMHRFLKCDNSSSRRSIRSFD